MVNRFHVGDRWADEDGDEWIVFAVSDDRTTCRAVLLEEQFVNASFLSDGKCIDDGWTLVLTRLISSERWIPFAEMMPEPPGKGNSKRLVICSESHQMLLLEELHGKWTHSESGIPAELSQALILWSWRYLLPPEAS